MKICPKCHSEYVDSLNYCTRCGTSLVDKDMLAESGTVAGTVPEVPVKKKLSVGKKIVLTILAITLVLFVVYDYLGSLTTYLRTDATQLMATKTGGEIEIGVDCDGVFWRIEECPDWIDIDKKEGKIKIAAEQNKSGQMRKGNIVLESGKYKATIAIVQTGFASYLQPSQTMVHFPRKGGKMVLKINTDGGDWKVECPSYLKAEKVDENTLELRAQENKGTVHEDFLLLTEDNVRAVIKVTQGGICKSCQGHGKMTCPFCSSVSSGYFICYRCGGTGIIKCSSCRGAGFID